MSVTLKSFRNGLGSLIDFTVKPKVMVKKRHEIGFKYDLRSNDVSSAWADVGYTIGESFATIVNTKELDQRFSQYRGYKSIFENELDLSGDISLDRLAKVIEQPDEMTQTGKIKKINGKFQWCYE